MYFIQFKVNFTKPHIIAAYSGLVWKKGHFHPSKVSYQVLEKIWDKVDTSSKL